MNSCNIEVKCNLFYNHLIYFVILVYKYSLDLSFNKKIIIKLFIFILGIL